MIRFIFIVITVILGGITIYCYARDKSKLASIISTFLTILSLFIAIYPKILEQEKIEPTISLNTNLLELISSDEYALKATIFPENCDIRWNSNNENIVVVDNNGYLKAVAEGNAIITASITYKDVEYSDICNISVKTPGITLDKTQSLHIGEIKSLTASTIPENVSILWKSSDPNIITVNDNGEIEGISEGTATITATITYNNINYLANCDIEVKSLPKESDDILSGENKINKQETTDSNSTDNNLIEENESTDVTLSDVAWIQSEKAYKGETATTMRGEQWSNCIILGSSNINEDGCAIIIAACDQKYSKFTAEIAPQEGFDNSEEVTVYIYGVCNSEQTFVEEYQIDCMTKNILIDIDITGIDELYIEKVGDYNMAMIGGQFINGKRV